MLTEENICVDPEDLSGRDVGLLVVEPSVDEDKVIDSSTGVSKPLDARELEPFRSLSVVSFQHYLLPYLISASSYHSHG